MYRTRSTLSGLRLSSLCVFLLRAFLSPLSCSRSMYWSFHSPYTCFFLFHLSYFHLVFKFVTILFHVVLYSVRLLLSLLEAVLQLSVVSTSCCNVLCCRRRQYVAESREDYDGEWTDTEERCNVAVEGHGIYRRIRHFDQNAGQ